MAVATGNVFAGVPDRTVGAIMVAPKGTALPVDAAAVPNVAFKDLGYISEDGVTLTQDLSWEKIRDWGGDQVRAILKEFTGGLKFTFLETNATAAAAIWGASNVTTTAATISTGTKNAVKLTSQESPRNAFLINIKDGVRRVRLVIADGQFTDRGDLSYTQSSAVTYDVTMSIIPDSSGVSVYVYTDDGVTL